jgi:hypothetical protein
MWHVLFIACSINNPGLCYPGTATVTASSVEECRENGVEGLAVFEARNPLLKVRAWTCRAPVLKGAIYE